MPVVQDPDPSEVPDTVPLKLNCLVGEVLDNPESDEWYVPKQGYRLSKVEMWKDQYNTYGFEVTYTPEIPGAVGWEPETHLFGTKDRDDNQESIEIDYQLAALGTCVDTEHSNPKYYDFEGF